MRLCQWAIRLQHGFGQHVLDDNDLAGMRRPAAGRFERPHRQQRQRGGEVGRQAARAVQAQPARGLVEQVVRGPGLGADQAARLVEQALQRLVIGGATYRERQDVLQTIEIQAFAMWLHVTVPSLV